MAEQDASGIAPCPDCGTTTGPNHAGPHHEQGCPLHHAPAGPCTTVDLDANAPSWRGEIVLACGHVWPGECADKADAETFLNLCLATNDTAFCEPCGYQIAITGPLREVAHGA